MMTDKEERVVKAMGETIIPGSKTVPASAVTSKELLLYLARAAIAALEEEPDSSSLRGGG